MKQQVIALTGGLDLTTDKLSVAQGSAQACLNYEVGVNRGIRRIDGFSRWDGRPYIAYSGFTFYVDVEGVTKKPLFDVGDLGHTLHIDSLSGDAVTADIIVTSVGATEEISGTGIYRTYGSASFIEPVNLDTPAHIAGVYLGVYIGEAASTEFIPSEYAGYQVLVTAVPGDSLTRVPGAHFLNDKLYAVVDLVAIRLTPTAAPMPLEGAPIYAVGETDAIGTLALARTADGSSTDVIWELFDYAPTTDIAAGVDLYTPTVTTNLVRNGNFFVAPATATDWPTVAPGGWAYSSGAAGVATATVAANALTHAMPVIAGCSYEITVTITRSVGSITPSIGGTSFVAALSASDTYTEIVRAATTGALTLTPAGFTGTVDDVSVRMVSPELITVGDFSAAGLPWTAGAGWNITGGVAAATNSSSALTHTFAPVSGRVYRVKFTVSGFGAGTVTVELGGDAGPARASDGTFVQYLTASGAGVLTFTAAGFTGNIDDVSVITVDKVGDVVAHVNPQRAGLYCADWDGAGGWSRVDLGRQLEYVETNATDADAFFLPYSRRGFISQLDAAEVLDTGWVGSDGLPEDIGGGSTIWPGLSAGALAADDGNEVGDSGHASLALRTNTLKATFSSEALQIPAGALVRGVEVRIYRRAQTGAREELVTIGCTSSAARSNKADGSRYLPVVAASAPGRDQTYGGANDIWMAGDIPDLKPSDINDGGFNVQLAYRLVGSGALASTYVDAVQVKVYYQEQTRKAFVNNTGGSPWDQEIEVIHHTVAEGSATGGASPGPGNGDRRGLLVINSSIGTAYTRPWLFGPDMGIYTEDDQGGALLAYCASTDEPITLASSYAVASENARYVFHSANPYASDLYDVIFIVNGAEHGHMFDGSYLLPIQTGLLAQFEKPRHVAWAGNYLALGYATGSVSISDLGDPLVYVGAASLAAEIGAGDRITGLVKLKGDSLGVFTESTIFAIQGTDPSTGLARVEISPSSGAIEYSVLNIGQPVFLDFAGPATLTTTDQYGDFSSGRLAEGATPWFLQRLQLPTRNQTVDRTFVAGYVMRNKRQCRYVFKDGWQASLTFTPADGVQVTTQRFYGAWGDRDATAITVLACCYGTTSTGQDVAFMTFARDPSLSRYRYVFQIDNGRSFDSIEIIAQWTSQPLQLGPPFYRKQLDQVGFHGRAYGHAQFKVFKGFDYTTPISDETTGASAAGTLYDFGVAGTTSADEASYKSMHTLRGEGEDVTILIESISASALPHTIQNLIVRFEPEDPKA